LAFVSPWASSGRSGASCDGGSAWLRGSCWAANSPGHRSASWFFPRPSRRGHLGGSARGCGPAVRRGRRAPPCCDQDPAAEPGHRAPRVQDQPWHPERQAPNASHAEPSAAELSARVAVVDPASAELRLPSYYTAVRERVAGIRAIPAVRGRGQEAGAIPRATPLRAGGRCRGCGRTPGCAPAGRGTGRSGRW
jgi:hypothetical protein